MIVKRWVAAALLAILGVGISGNAQQSPDPTNAAEVFNKVSLESALKTVCEQAGLTFSLDAGVNAEDLKVAVEDTQTETDDALVGTLRPLGLVAIRVEENHIVIEPETSQRGRLKYFGQTIRTGRDLLQKLEGATFADGQIHVPEWTPQDDQKLMQTVPDAVAVAKYLEARVGVNIKNGVAVQNNYTSCFDPDVKAGAILSRAEVRNLSGEKMSQLLENQDPVVRATWAFSKFGLSWHGKSYRDSLKDQDPFVRLAVLMALGSKSMVAGDLREDTNETVRFFSNLMLLQKLSPQKGEEADELITAILSSPNPLFKLLVLTSTFVDQGKWASAIKEKANTLDDPFLKHVRKYIQWQDMTDTTERDMFNRIIAADFESPVLTDRLLALWAWTMTLPERRGPKPEVLTMRIVPPESDIWKIMAKWVDNESAWMRSVPLAFEPFHDLFKEAIPPELGQSISKHYQDVLTSEEPLKRQRALVLGYWATSKHMTASQPLKEAYRRGYRSKLLFDQIVAGNAVVNRNVFALSETLEIIADDQDKTVASQIAARNLARQLSGNPTELRLVLKDLPPSVQMELAKRVRKLKLMKGDIYNEFIRNITHLPALSEAVKQASPFNWHLYIPHLKKAIESKKPENCALIADIIYSAMFNGSWKELKDDERSDLNSIFQELFTIAENSEESIWADKLCCALLSRSLSIKRADPPVFPDYFGENAIVLEGKAEKRLLDLMTHWNSPKRADLAIKALATIKRYENWNSSSHQSKSGSRPLTESVLKEYNLRLENLIANGDSRQVARLHSTLRRLRSWVGERLANILERRLIAEELPLKLGFINAIGAAQRTPSEAMKETILNAPISRKEKILLLSQVKEWINPLVEFALAERDDGTSDASALVSLNYELRKKGYTWHQSWNLLTEAHKTSFANALLVLAGNEAAPKGDRMKAVRQLTGLHKNGVYGGVELAPHYEKIAHPSSDLAVEILRDVFKVNPESTIFRAYLAEYDTLSPKLMRSTFVVALNKPAVDGSRDYVLKVIQEQKDNDDFWKRIYWIPFKFPEDPELRRALESLKNQKQLGRIYKAWDEKKENTTSLLRFDVNGDGRVDDDEKQQAAEAILERMESKGQLGQLRTHDKNGNGILEKAERKAAIQEITKKL